MKSRALSSTREKRRCGVDVLWLHATRKNMLLVEVTIYHLERASRRGECFFLCSSRRGAACWLISGSFRVVADVAVCFREQVDGADGKAAAQVLVDIATAPLTKAGSGKKGKRRTSLTRPLVRPSLFGCLFVGHGYPGCRSAINLRRSACQQRVLVSCRHVRQTLWYLPSRLFVQKRHETRCARGTTW